MIDHHFIDYCVSRGLFSREAFDALPVSDEVSAYDLIIRKGLASQQQLAISAGDYYNIPVADVNQIKPDPAALACGHLSLCKKLLFLPFNIDATSGLLIAMADCANQELIRKFYHGKGIARMQFYIAPYEDLMRMINLSYERAREVSGLIQIPEGLRRSASQTSGLIQLPETRSGVGLRKASSDLDEITAFPLATSNSEQNQIISQLLATVDMLQAEQDQLYQQIDRLTYMLELEMTLTRELLKKLKTGGTLSAVAFEQLLDILK